MITHDHYLAYMKTSHDVGGELNVPELYENKEEEQWELMTYVLCEVLGWGGIWVSEGAGGSATSTSDARSTSAFRTTPGGCGRWAGCSSKHHITWAELTDRLAEVQARYADGLGGRLPDAERNSRATATASSETASTSRRSVSGTHAYSPGRPARRGSRSVTACGSGPARDVLHPHTGVRPRRRRCDRRGHLRARARGRDLGSRGCQAGWFYIVRFNQSELWDNYTGPKNDTLQTEIPERWLEAVG